MYIVTITNGNYNTVIHNDREKLYSGNIVKGINSIDSFTFSLLPSNVGFNLINEFTTLVSVYNTNKKRYDFYGRVLYTSTEMSESGLIRKDVTCESYFGFLCDSQQTYVVEQNWTVTGLLNHIIDTHNSQVEEYKRFVIGEVSADLDPNDNLYIGIQRENTWKTIEEKLLKTLGGEIRFRVVDDVIYLDYLTQLGETKATKIEISRNMKAIAREKNPTEYVTRLIPLGAKLDENSEERLDITSVNDGLNYIDDVTAIEVYGIHVAYVTFDDVTVASNLLSKGREWLAQNNKVQIKYSITALDLSLLGLDIDDFEVCNSHPIINGLLGIDDIARIIKENINVCEEIQSTIEVGENFKTLSDIQREQAERINQSITRIESKTNNLPDNVDAEFEQIRDIVTERYTSSITTCESMIFTALERYVETSNYEEFKETLEAELAIMADEIVMNFTTTTEQITNVDGDLQTKFTELYKYISFADGSITLGSSENAITLTIEHNNIVFKRNGVEFGSWDGENFYTGNIVVRVNERAQLGNFAFVPRSDGSLSFLKVGG